jgi:hypothetical protein
MSWGLQILPCLSLILLLWNQVPGLEGQEFRFGSCQVTGVVLPELWEAFWTVKNTVVSAHLEHFPAGSPLGGGYFFRIVDPFPACLISFPHKNPVEFRRINTSQVTHEEIEAQSSMGSLQ